MQTKKAEIERNALTGVELVELCFQIIHEHGLVRHFLDDLFRSRRPPFHMGRESSVDGPRQSLNCNVVRVLTEVCSKTVLELFRRDSLG